MECRLTYLALYSTFFAFFVLVKTMASKRKRESDESERKKESCKKKKEMEICYQEKEFGLFASRRKREAFVIAGRKETSLAFSVFGS